MFYVYKTIKSTVYVLLVTAFCDNSSVVSDHWLWDFVLMFTFEREREREREREGGRDGKTLSGEGAKRGTEDPKWASH